ncbi:reverse transcriptase, partial [Rhizoctonia solani]
MTDNPEPKGKGISSRFSNILRRSTRSTSDLSGIHEHDIASEYPIVRKVIKKPKNNDSNDSISIYASDDSDKKPRKTANLPSRKPVHKNPFSAIPSGGTQEAVASALAETDRISDYTLSPPPTVPLVASPPRSPVVANAGITLVISSSQESEQVRDAGAALAQLAEYTLDDEHTSSLPKINLVETEAISRPGSTTPTRSRTKPNERQVTPMEDWVFSSQELHWFKRLEAGGYPDNEALERCIKYYTITNKAIANIIENRQLYDDTEEEKNSTNAFIQKIEKLGNQISTIAENALYNGTEAAPSRPESPIKQDEDEDTYMGEPEPDPKQPNLFATEATWGTNAKPGEWGGYTNPPRTPTYAPTADPTDPTQIMLKAILSKMGQLDDIKSRLNKLEGKSPQVLTAQTSTPRAKTTPKPNPEPTANPPQTRPSFANVAAKAPAKAPEVKASNIASAIKRDIAKPAPAQSDDKNFVVRFKTLPVTQPNPESIFVAMRECLDAANRNLGKGRLTRVRWSLKASLHLSFSNNVSITAIENAIPLLMDRLRLPEYEFGPEVPWSRLVVTNVPTGLGGSLQQMRNREELTQLLNEAFPDSAKFGSVKLTLAPDWLADPARLQAEGRHASTVSFAFEDAGENARSRNLTLNPYFKSARNAFDTDTPNANAEPRNPDAINADATTTRPTNTTQTTAPGASAMAKATRVNASTALLAVYTLQTGLQSAMTERHFIQLNVAGCNPRMHALLNEPLYAHFDIFIFQDIWWGCIGSQKNIDPNLHNIYGTTNSNNYICVIPPGFTDKKGPSVAIYIRKDQNIHAQFSNCIPTHRNILALDIFINNHKLTVINVYAHGKDAHKTIDHITNEFIPNDRPIILTGDFNLHHPDWALDGSKWKARHPNQTEREFREYAEFNDLTIMNSTHLPTCIAPNPTSNSIIDLTLLNPRAVEAWPNFNWEVNTPSTGRSCGLDHMAITWSTQPFNQDKPAEDATITSHRPINPKQEDKWVKAYAKALKQFNLPEDPNSAKDADLITGAILEAMSTATVKTMPNGNKKKKSNGPPRSPWWNAECSGALNNLKHNPENQT